jgi:hypothetical protein
MAIENKSIQLKNSCQKSKRLSNKATTEETVARGFEPRIVKVF